MQSFKVNPVKEKLLHMLAEKIPHPLSSPEEKIVELKGSPTSYIDLKESLHSNLVNRDIEISHVLYTSQTTTLVEVFTLTSKKTFTGCKKYVEDDVKYISVFWKYGQFYACLTLKRYTYDPSHHNDFIPLMGKREKLDKYILKVAEILSGRFSKPLRIHYKNMICNTDEHFFSIFDIEMNHEPDRKKFMKSPTNGTSKKILSSHKTDSKSDDELDFLQKCDLEAERDYKVKCECAQQVKKAPKRVTTNNKMSIDEEDEINPDVDNTEPGLFNTRSFRNIFSNTKSQERPDIQSDTVKSIFESQPFEEGKSFDHDTVSETSNESIISYPKLKSKFEFSEEDFFRDIDHDCSDDMKKLLKLVQGYEDNL